MKRPDPTFLDRAVARISPARGVQRMKARAQYSAMVNPGPVQRRGGSRSGTLFNWIVNKLTRFNEGQERETVTERAQDLTANNAHAASCVESMSTNVVGTGLQPQARPQYKRLGISKEQAKEFGQQAEWIYNKWCRHADIGNRLHFRDIQFLAAYSMLMNGEYLFLPTMRRSKPAPGQSSVRLALQALSPVRMATPYDLGTRMDIRDGVHLDQSGAPRGYFVATPKSGKVKPSLTSEDFAYYPANIGHRPGVFHSFHAAAKEPGRVRGVSVLAPAMKQFKDLSDYLDFELVGNIVASSFPVFIEQQAPQEYADTLPSEGSGDDKTRYQEVDPGTIMYGNAGEKPHVLKSDRPSNTFDGFVETILRSIGASIGLPYEVVAKDFSKTNYSSARAALLEAWRVYMLHRKWLERHFCQPVYELVLEEAWLRGELQLPQGGPDFYEAMAEYCNATWIGPPRGHVDPEKEAKANQLLLKENVLTLADWSAEMGHDWESQVEQRSEEAEKVQQEMPQPQNADEGQQ